MILAITRENEKLIYEVCKENGFESPQVLTGVESLKRFAVQELRNLNNYNQIIIDIASTKETEDEIVQSVVAIKSMYNIKIIVVALGFREGNNLLAKLFNEGIYNFVNADNYYEQKEQFKNCLSKEGCQYKDAVRFRQKIEDGKKNKVIIKKEYKKLKQFVNIAVAGTEKHIGVTTQAILITMFLKGLNMNACYICSNDKNEVKNLEKLDGVVKKNGFFSYNGIDLYSNDSKIDAMQYGYDFYIYDYGVLDESTLDNFMSKEVKVIVGGTKPWEYDDTFRAIFLLKEMQDINYIFNFASNQEKAKIRKLLSKVIKHIYFSDYTTDTFNNNINAETYHEIFKDYIAEKSNKLEVIEKKGLFSFLKKR
mgnify:FL=1